MIFFIQVCRKLPRSSLLQRSSRAPRSLDLLFYLFHSTTNVFQNKVELLVIKYELLSRLEMVGRDFLHLLSLFGVKINPEVGYKGLWESVKNSARTFKDSVRNQLRICQIHLRIGWDKILKLKFLSPHFHKMQLVSFCTRGWGWEWLSTYFSVGGYGPALATLTLS